jgi:hypothetical protein
VALDRQIQGRVSGMQIPHPRRSVCHPLHAYGPEHRLQGAGVPGLDPGAAHALISDHLLEALLARGPQREMIIKQPPQ